MSIYQDRIDPNDPLYYAPLRTRERQNEPQEQQYFQHDIPINEFADERMPYDALLEHAVAEALRHPLDPVFLDPPDFDESRAEILLRLAGRVSAALIVAAFAVAFFTFAIPGARSFPAAEQWLSSLWPSSAAKVPGELQSASALTGTTKASRLDGVSPEQAEALLQQFVQWQQKPASTLGQAK